MTKKNRSTQNPQAPWTVYSI